MGVFIYYKEVIAVLFFTLTLEFISRRRQKNVGFEIVLLIMFPTFLIAWAFLDPENRLYDDKYTQRFSNSKKRSFICSYGSVFFNARPY
jgi:hypothetical protein